MSEQRDAQPAALMPTNRRRWRAVWGRWRLPTALFLAGIVLGAVTLGRWTSSSPNAAADSASEEATPAGPQKWYCSMHPQIVRSESGLCPICHMELVPLESHDDGGPPLGPRQLRMSKAASALADIRTVPVRREYVTKTIRMVGKVAYDETRMADITAWVGGRIDRLYVDYTGITVNKGDRLAELYSPELIVAQQELLTAAGDVGRGRSDRPRRDGPQRTLAPETMELADEKLRLLGLLPEQIEQIKKRGSPTDRLEIHATASGVVTALHVNEGQYVERGSKIYTIADLSHVWVFLDAYESDLPWLRYGQQVEFTTETYPGETFTGRIAFIEPMLNEPTRTVKVRVNVPNESGRLKPGMFVRGLVRSRLAEGGRVFDPSLAGKWISPKHPEVVKEAPGQCDVCGVDLIPVERLGWVATPEQREPPLVIPTSAPLLTGQRAVVYVKLPGREQPTFEGREVVLGQRAGDRYIVRSGLAEGEQVVVQGNFKIDAALQIQAKPSMMSSTGSQPITVPDGFRRALSAVYDPYLRLQRALADDRLDEARGAWQQLRRGVAQVPTETLSSEVDRRWRPVAERLQQALATRVGDADLETIRLRFEAVAGAMLEVAATFGHPGDVTLVEVFCPHAFDRRGALWLQEAGKVANPYFGARMLRCGERRREFPPAQLSAGKEADK